MQKIFSLDGLHVMFNDSPESLLEIVGPIVKDRFHLSPHDFEQAAAVHYTGGN